MLYFYSFCGVKAVLEVLVETDVTQLVANDLGVSDDGVDVGVGVAVDPGFDAGIGYVIA
jgi:hypothetical protein